jgi:hypothetical protein
MLVVYDGQPAIAGQAMIAGWRAKISTKDGDLA